MERIFNRERSQFRPVTRNNMRKVNHILLLAYGIFRIYQSGTFSRKEKKSDK
ncbi:hypothetical protein XBP1_3010073 [Xenorhabdus bovienii str. puntauvense]|uniref:Uncharacterized protein n=3 Tax=Xenorhabdus bovienii TaxID=40576 RepID=A0A0B6XAC6_XENBV|nr:hypothetical protein XBP1_3010073 [Xenorhabdus bovienii str. puntauvense]CDH00734.1 hypothetical protein XBFM1_1740097 [Xenorhabdus bovienii str. feltiae Moldova]CDM90530.1 protein of unknown function [Xenorhabdus bovienii]